MIANKRKVAVVLSGGGAKGAYEVGALRAIVRHRLEIHILTGASIGAINAAVLAYEYEKTGNMKKAVEKLQAAWLDFDELFTLSLGRIAWAMLVSCLKTKSPLNFSSLLDNSRIKAKLKELIPPDLKISQLTRIELIINATSLTDGKTISFSRTNDAYLYDAVLASSCLPLVFTPRQIANKFYVDGGVFNNTPLRDALRAQATEVFVVELKPKTKELYLETIPDQSSFNTVHQVGSRMMELIMDKIMYEDLKKAKKINNILETIVALEATGNRTIAGRLKKSIGYEKDGQIKRYVRFHEIAPSQRLEPPGTFGFADKMAIREIIKLGELDAQEQLEAKTTKTAS